MARQVRALGASQAGKLQDLPWATGTSAILATTARLRTVGTYINLRQAIKPEFRIAEPPASTSPLSSSWRRLAGGCRGNCLRRLALRRWCSGGGLRHASKGRQFPAHVRGTGLPAGHCSGSTGREACPTWVRTRCSCGLPVPGTRRASSSCRENRPAWRWSSRRNAVSRRPASSCRSDVPRRSRPRPPGRRPAG